MKDTCGYTSTAKNCPGTLFQAWILIQVGKLKCTKEACSVDARFLYKNASLYRRRRETISTNRVYTSVLRSMEDRSEIDTHTHTHTPTLLKIVQRNDSEEVGKEGKEEGRKKVRKVVERKRSKSTCPGDRSLKIFLHLVRDFTSLDFTNNRLLLYYYTSLRNYHSSLIFLF